MHAEAEEIIRGFVVSPHACTSGSHVSNGRSAASADETRWASLDQAGVPHEREPCGEQILPAIVFSTSASLPHALGGHLAHSAWRPWQRDRVGSNEACRGQKRPRTKPHFGLARREIGSRHSAR
jgi:hypothetical protein